MRRTEGRDGRGPFGDPRKSIPALSKLGVCFGAPGGWGTGPTGPPAQYRGRGCSAPDPPHGASSSVLRVQAVVSCFSRELGFTECAGGPGGLQDGSGGPGALTEEGVELPYLSWGWGGGGISRVGVECRAPHVLSPSLHGAWPRRTATPGWACWRRGAQAAVSTEAAREAREALGSSQGSCSTHPGWQTRKPGPGAGRWWPGTVARPARESGPHGHEP